MQGRSDQRECGKFRSPKRELAERLSVRAEGPVQPGAAGKAGDALGNLLDAQPSIASRLEELGLDPSTGKQPDPEES